MKKFYSVFLILTLCLLSGCSKSEISSTYIFFDTTVTLTADCSQSVLDGAFSLCEKYEDMLSRTIDSSEIARLNRGETVTVSDETLYLINKSAEYTRLSGGRFDITVASVSSLYDFHSHTLPESEKIAEALKSVGTENIIINGNSVSLINGAQLDLGGIAKGFIADKIKEYFISKGVKSAVINLGGNIITIGKQNDTVGVKTPFSSEVFAEIKIPEQSYVTSGVDQRYITVNGKNYHHIIDTKTGYSAQSDLLQATVIGESSADCDALSTTLILLGEKQGLELINSYEGFEAVLYTADGRVVVSSGISFADGIISRRR